LDDKENKLVEKRPISLTHTWKKVEGNGNSGSNGGAKKLPAQKLKNHPKP